jgi:hypothetical protein
MTSGAKYRIDTHVASDSMDSRLIKLNDFEKYISIVMDEGVNTEQVHGQN